MRWPRSPWPVDGASPGRSTNWPTTPPRGAIALKDLPSLYRIRIGDYRVIYQVQDATLVVLVVRIGSRGDVYRHLP